MTPTSTSPVSQTSAQQRTQPPQTEQPLSSDFDTFIRMLTAQARYQDPLQPLDSAEYAAQLAQFSMVEQQTLTNNTLSALVSQLGASDMAKLSSWVGQEVRAVAPAHFSGDPVTISPAPLATADRVVLVVRDSSGTIVDQTDIPVSAEPVTWSGLNSDGTQRDTGLYSFSVQSYSGGELLLDEAAATYHQVAEAQIENDNVVLILDGGQAILSTTVTAVRAGS